MTTGPEASLKSDREPRSDQAGERAWARYMPRTLNLARREIFPAAPHRSIIRP